MRALFAHPKGMEGEKIDADVALLTDLLTKEIGEPVEVVSGRDDYLMHAASAGGWKGWATDVAKRIDSMTRKPFYELFVVPQSTIGGATQIMLAHAMHMGKPVLVMEIDHDAQTLDLRQAKAIVCEDAEDYTAGWWIDT